MCFLSCIYLWGWTHHTCHGAHVEGFVISSHYMWLRDRTQTLRLGNKYLHLLSLPTSGLGLVLWTQWCTGFNQLFLPVSSWVKFQKTPKAKSVTVHSSGKSHAGNHLLDSWPFSLCAHPRDYETEPDPDDQAGTYKHSDPWEVTVAPSTGTWPRKLILSSLAP